MRDQLKPLKLSTQQKQEIANSLNNLTKYLIFQEHFAQMHTKPGQTYKPSQTVYDDPERQNNEVQREQLDYRNNDQVIQDILDTANTDWTNANNIQQTQDKIADGDLIGCDYDYDKIGVQDGFQKQQALNQLNCQLKNQGETIDLEQYHRYFDSLIKNSHEIYKSYIWNIYQQIDSTKSSVDFYFKQLTYPISKLFIVCRPRNSFGTLPGLKPRDQYESEENYVKVRDGMIYELSQALCAQITAKCTYGAISFEEGYQVLQFDTIQTMYYNLQGSAACVKQILNQALENEEVLLVSRQFLESFKIHFDDVGEINDAYTEMTGYKLKSYVQERDSPGKMPQYLRGANVPVVKLALSVQGVDQNSNETAGATNTVLGSLDLKWTSPHYNSERGTGIGKKAQQRVIVQGLNTGSFRVSKASKKAEAALNNGIVDLKLLKQGSSDKEVENIIEKLEMNRFFIQTAGLAVSNYQYAPNLEFQPKKPAYLLFPRIHLQFHYINNVYQASQTSITPCFNIVKGSGKLYFNGLVAHNTAQNQPLQLSYNMTSKLFSHVLFQLSSVKTSIGIGFQLTNGEQIIVDLHSGTVSKSEKQKLQIQVMQQQKLQNDDLICVQYFVTQKMTQLMYVQLIRLKLITTLAVIEVPEDDCVNLICLMNENDSVSICKGQINTISADDLMKQQQSKKRR